MGVREFLGVLVDVVREGDVLGHLWAWVEVMLGLVKVGDKGVVLG